MFAFNITVVKIIEIFKRSQLRDKCCFVNLNKFHDVTLEAKADLIDTGLVLASIL